MGEEDFSRNGATAQRNNLDDPGRRCAVAGEIFFIADQRL